MTLNIPSMQELLRFRAVDSYGASRHISALLPALSAVIGHPMPTSMHPDPESDRQSLGLPCVSSAVVVLVDGLGFWNLALRTGHAPYLRKLMERPGNDKPIATTVPSTTPIVLGVFGTGSCPGKTGMVGFTQRNTATGGIGQLISFAGAPDPVQLQPQETIFERLAAQGVRVTSVGLPKFARSSLTQAALRGGSYCGPRSVEGRVDAACRAAKNPGLTYYYIEDVDKAGHHYGPSSDQWASALETADEQLAALRRGLPEGTLLVVTADHGMVSPQPNERVDIGNDPALAEGVALVGGEPRMVMLYADEGTAVDELAARWRDRLGHSALVLTRQEAIERGLYGEVEPRVEPLIGDVVACATGVVSIVDSRIQSAESMALPGMHGSLTRLEREIPCLIDVA
jgi:hypothetical protein